MRPISINERSSLRHNLPIDFNITLPSHLVNLAQLYMGLGNADTRPDIQSKLINLLLEHLRLHVSPWIKAYYLGWVGPGWLWGDGHGWFGLGVIWFVGWGEGAHCDCEGSID